MSMPGRSGALALAIDACAGNAESDLEFLRWMETEYVPIAGGWQY